MSSRIQDQPTAHIHRPRRRSLFPLGAVVLVLGVVIYAVQFSMKQLVVPWYAPFLATVGVVLMATSVWQRRGVVRTIALVLFTLVCGFEWFFLLVVAKSPDYRGPAEPGHPIPAFTAALADGKPFTSENLQDGRRSVLLFFRGRW